MKNFEDELFLKVGDLVKFKKRNKKTSFWKNKKLGIIIKLSWSTIPDQSFNMNSVPVAYVKWCDGYTTNTTQSLLKIVAKG